MGFSLLGGVLLGFFGVEVISGLAHRYLFHGPLWFIHRTHHEARQSKIELNDVFAIIFGAPSVLFFVYGQSSPLLMGMGIGVCFYGALYFVVHDAWVHHRWKFGIKPSNRLFKFWIQGHRQHHQKVAKEGQGPYGLFLWF